MVAIITPFKFHKQDMIWKSFSKIFDLLQCTDANEHSELQKNEKRILESVRKFSFTQPYKDSVGKIIIIEPKIKTLV